MAHLNENALEKYEHFDRMHPVEWVSRMSPVDVVVLKTIIRNSCLGGNTNLHGERLVYPIEKHAHIRTLHKHLDKSKEHLIAAMMHKGKGGLVSSALKTVVKGVKTGLKGATKAAKVIWAAIQKGSKAAVKLGMKGAKFYSKHRGVIDKTLEYGSTALDVAAQVGSSVGLWDEKTAARLAEISKGTKSFASRDSKNQKPAAKAGKGALIGYDHH